jgi:hypothetical protein
MITSVAEFEAQWKSLAQEIGKRIMLDSEVSALKKKLEANGFLTFAEKSIFITIADKLKYELIYEKYGPHNSDGYKEFERLWQEWLQVKDPANVKIENKSQENASHFMYGSTPDPEKFLMEFDPDGHM